MNDFTNLLKIDKRYIYDVYENNGDKYCGLFLVDEDVFDFLAFDERGNMIWRWKNRFKSPVHRVWFEENEMCLRMQFGGEVYLDYKGNELRYIVGK